MDIRSNHLREWTSCLEMSPTSKNRWHNSHDVIILCAAVWACSLLPLRLNHERENRDWGDDARMCIHGDFRCPRSRRSGNYYTYQWTLSMVMLQYPISFHFNRVINLLLIKLFFFIAICLVNREGLYVLKCTQGHSHCIIDVKCKTWNIRYSRLAQIGVDFYSRI